MAELIPVHYRARVATRQRIRTWMLWGFVTFAACAACLSTAYARQLRSASALDELRSEHRSRLALIVRAQELRNKRQDLADRMQKIQQLMDDKVLLALLHDISQAFSSNDCLEYIHIDARGKGGDGAAPRDGNQFVVRLTGITNSSTGLAELMTRLNTQTQPRVDAVLENSRRETYLDGQVMRFQITCARPAEKS